jgi:cytochrome c
MDSWEITKVASAVLLALLLIVGAKTAIEIAQAGHGHGEKIVGYKLPVTAAAATTTASPAAAAFDAKKVVAMVAKASAEAGQDAFKKCTTCHTPAKGGKNGTGPNLWGIVNKPKAAADGFAYSPVLKGKGGNWTYEDLANYIYAPAGWLPGNKMAFAGVKDSQELADVIAYLRTLADSPAPLPQ